MKHRNHRGNVALIFVIALPLILAIMSFVVDLGRGYLKCAHLQNAADAAALAAVSELPLSTDDAKAIALEYAAKYGVNSAEVTVAFPGDDLDRISVTISHNIRYLFAPIIKQYSGNVKVNSEAQTGVPGAMNGVVPIGVEERNFVFGDVYTLKVGAGACDKTGAPGSCSNYGPLSLGNSGAATYESNIMHGYQGRIEAGQWVFTEPGDMVGPTKAGIKFRIDAAPTETYLTYASGSPRVVYLPIIETLNVAGRDEVLVTGFAAFFLDTIMGSSEVKGRFLKLLVPGDISISAADFGLRSIMLVR